MRPADNTVVVLSDSGRNDAINGMMRAFAAVIEQHSLDVEYFDAGRCTQEDMTTLVKLLSSGIVKFGLTYLGIGQDLSITLKGATEPRNAWEVFNVPLVKIHGDSPAYFLQRHGDTPSNSVNIYASEEFLEFRRWALPDSKAISALCGSCVISDVPRDRIDFARREKGKLFFVKTGGDPAKLTALWRQQLPDSTYSQLMDAADEMRTVALKPGPFSVLRFVLDYFASRQIDPRGLETIVRLFVAQLDDYLRRVKSSLVAKVLLEFPVVIQGSDWEHLDTSRAKAQLIPPARFESLETIFQNELGVVDMSPNVYTSAHDRMWRAAGAYAFALTSRSAWLEDLLPELNARGYDFNEDSIRASVDYALSHPAECVGLGERYGEAFRARYPTQAWVDKLVAVADLARLQGSPQKPALQPYFVW